jgi:ABC-2 type transport system permease protein
VNERLRKILAIAKRELSELLGSPWAWSVCALLVAIDGLLFNAFALGVDPKPSTRVIEDLLQILSATTMVFAILLSMRAIAEERDRGTFVLLASAPLRDSEIVLGKFAANLAFLGLMLATTIHLPWLVLIRGSVSLAHLATGYLGLGLLGAAALSLGLLGSALAKRQLAAGLLGTGLLTLLLIGWLLARISDPPLDALLDYFALWQTHFQPFQRGILGLSHVTFFASVSALSLALATRLLEASRWR